MGNDHDKVQKDMSKIKIKEAGAIADALNLKKYNKLGVIGRGGFGKVIKHGSRFGKFRIKKIEKSMR